MRRVRWQTFSATLKLQAEAGETFSSLPYGEIMRDSDRVTVAARKSSDVGTDSERHFYFLNLEELDVPRDRATIRAAWGRLNKLSGRVPYSLAERGQI
jgi:hypothetical protein